MSDETEYFYFFRNWWMMAEGRDTDEKRLAFYDAIFRYAFEGTIPEKPIRGESPGKVWAAYDGFLAAKATIDQVVRKIKARMAAGSKGGLAGTGAAKARVGNQNASKDRTEEKLNTSKPQAKRKQNATDKDKDNDNDKDNDIGGTPPSGASVADLDSLFSLWWTAYPGPRKADKKKCREKFVKTLQKSENPQIMFRRIMDGLEVWKKCDTWTRDNGAFIRGPLVWLNNENWNDTPSATPSAQPKAQLPVGMVLQQEGYDLVKFEERFK